ncbi:MAG TPA: 4,5-DOPA dioxygenase extradiol [Patescibacteria group bacterium]|nr:4,5-DOPA dioxygenase extradiol [Patescibacteria group bacterium]
MKNHGNKMPALFVGHGSPMNAIEDNEYSRGWAKIAGEIPVPRAILAISAHWYVPGSRINDEAQPNTIYDMYGFPDELYRVEYKAPGSPELARSLQEAVGNGVRVDNSWGIDHGTWSVLCNMYPQANIPLVQLSVDSGAEATEHFRIGQQLRSLREQGVMIFGSGNVVHNLAKISWSMNGGHSWAVDFDNYIRNKIASKEYQDVIHYEKAGASVRQAFFTPEHFYPLLYVLGAAQEEDTLSIFNDSCTLGSLSMTSYLFQ